MSSALTAATPLNVVEEAPGTTPRTSHLTAVGATELAVGPATTLPATDIRQAAHLGQVALGPREEFAPSENSGVLVGRSNVFDFRDARRSRSGDDEHLRLLGDIKRMTRTIGSALIEAELGIRPFWQLGSWLEFELFHKLKARVYHCAREKHMAARRGEDASRKVPSVTTIGVRAAMRPSGDWESSMTIRVGERARAIAMRLQRHRDRWRVIALEVG